MANKQLFLNNFISVFAAAVKNAATTGTPATELDYGILRLSNGAAGQLVNPTAGDYYVLTAFKKSGSVESAVEIMNVTAIDNSVINECRITVTRAQESTTVQAYVAGDYISLRLTQVGAANFTQNNDPKLAAQANLTTHIADATNPHATTKAQVGLSIVDNVASATMLARANHTGTQLSATISDFAATVLAGVLTGLSLATTTAVAATDSVLIAFGKLQAQVTANLSRANQTGTQLAATISDFAATVLGGVLTGLSLATATAVTAADTILVAIGKLQAQATAAIAALALRVTQTSGTGSAVVPAGTTAQRDAAPIAGYLRWNQTLAAFEGYSGAVWSLLAGAASGANNDITSLGALTAQTGFRNLLINANAAINQRAYVSGTATGAAIQYTVDRWRVITSGQSLVFTASGNGNAMTAPAGGLEQVIEGANIGIVNAVINWVGTATCTVDNVAKTKGQTVTLVPGTNCSVKFFSGTVSLPQIEAGPVPTPFEYRSVGTELALCQRYLPAFSGVDAALGLFSGQCYNATTAEIVVPFQVQTRISPTGLIVSNAADFRLYSAAGGGVATTNFIFARASKNSGSITAATAGGLVAGNATIAYGAPTGSPLILFTGCEL